MTPASLRRKKGDCVGPTKRGKGSKWMVVVYGQGVPLGGGIASASPAEVTLAEEVKIRYKRRWKIERTFAWLGNFRRLVVRYERLARVYLAFFHLACIIIALRQF